MNTRGKRRRLPLQCLRRHIALPFPLILLLLITAAAAGAASTSAPTINPYDILSVPQSADQATIRKQYKRLCLKYHPDKNVDRPDSEKKRCEEAFKKVQLANELIGEEEARRRYDFRAKYGSYGSARAAAGAAGGYYPYGANRHQRHSSSNPFGAAGFNPYDYYPRARPRRAFYVNGVDVSHLFRNGFPSPWGGGGGGDPTQQQQQSHSVYIQNIVIPLEELYEGNDSKVLQVQDNIWARYRAAIRGGSAGRVALQAAVSSIPLLLRTSVPVTAFAFVIAFHVGLPRPTRLLFPVAIKRGWKGGTKITFNSGPDNPMCDVCFVLKEGKHPSYTREGNHLRTTTVITPKQAKDGCILHVEPISHKTELPYVVRLRPGEMEGKKSHEKRLVGKGWPGRKSRGDLIIQIKVEPTIGDADDTGDADNRPRERRRWRRKLRKRQKRKM